MTSREQIVVGLLELVSAVCFFWVMFSSQKPLMKAIGLVMGVLILIEKERGKK